MTEWFRPAGSTARDGYDLVVRPGEQDWHHTGLTIRTLQPGQSVEFDTEDCEYLVLPLSGSAEVVVDGETVPLAGRADVFAGPTDLAYVPRGTRVAVVSADGARIAFPHAKAAGDYPFRRLGTEQVETELRGAGVSSRQVRNFGTPAVLEADSIIACEVLTPAGNWSSYPPHKHDEHKPGEESVLEEIYYFEMQLSAEAPEDVEGNDPIGYQRVYGTDDRPIDVLAEVRNGDLVLVPHGWHGPAMAPPGYDMYYLNVMAGPGSEREWLISDDPQHGWVRKLWDSQQLDPRLPFGTQ
ncbi:Myo-inositol catabolism IolB domain protein [Kribbella flavida DSM 17836]|uniref:Myo-inositol catabolism IolB domain protein n=1 Tax=Kribbella flavida (strain DSM 17836 / JCM 10339 / NBRC 14399) TaxID=479435 RepID=D2PMN9_KRIFD|nr:5-deoxy-glucuronate isomerase [Kribbella flavida]ADB30783.1 Myo-inositol catabolism IolB domain protein [Kribbella flavida DSM 17836]